MPHAVSKLSFIPVPQLPVFLDSELKLTLPAFAPTHAIASPSLLNFQFQVNPTERIRFVVDDNEKIRMR